MIDAVKGLGRLAIKAEASRCGILPTDSEAFLRSLIMDWDGKEILRIIFPLPKGEIRFSPRGLESDRLAHYLWVGNAAGNKPQNRLTTNKLDYLLSQSIPSILHDLDAWQVNDSDMAALRELLLSLKDAYFVEAKVRGGFMVDPQALGVAGCGMDLKNIVSNLMDREGINPKERPLFTMAVERGGKVEELVRHLGYHKYLERSILRLGEAVYGVCHLCNGTGEVLPNPDFPSGSPLKIYVVDKSGFMSGVSGSIDARKRTLALCPRCLRELHAGINYVEVHLRLRAGPFNVYLIPQLPKDVQPEDLEDWCRGMSQIFGAVNSFKELGKFQQKLEEEAEDLWGGQYTLHLIFGRPTQSKFDYKLLVQDVPVSRLHLLRQRVLQWMEFAGKFFGDPQGDGSWHLGFREISRIFPIRVRRGAPSEWMGLLELYNSMLSGTEYPALLLIRRGLLLARIHRYGNYKPYQIGEPANPDRQLAYDLVRVNLLMSILKDLGVLVVEPMHKLEQEEPKTLGALKGPKELKEWIERMKYDPEQQALFLMGVLLARIGVEQYNRGDRKKAILDKVRFEGMDLDRVMSLASRVLDYLRMYRLMGGENEVLYGYMMELLNECAKNWRKTQEENVFYILSGYAFMTTLIITSGGGNREQ